MYQRIATIAWLSACAGFAQSGNQLRDWTPTDEPRVKPRIACADLRSLTGYEFSVLSAVVQPATADAPEYCRVSGQALPEIRFEVGLPSAWNRRLYMHGNGGFAGESLDQPNRARQRFGVMRKGFVAAATNTGHDAAEEPLATFALHRQKLIDYAFRSLHVTAETAKKIAAAYFGTPPVRSYFDGCSTGGRQGLILAQRFPDDFDGILVGAPVLNFSGTMVSYAWTAQALARAAIPSAKMALLAGRVYAQCDAKDGLADGLIDDPRRCGFRPAADLPRCAGETDASDCFTSRQIDTLEKIYAEVTSQGKRLFPGWPVGAEIAGANGRSGWDGWIIRDGARTTSVAFAESFFGHMGFPEKNPGYELSRFDFDKDPQRLEWISGVLDATDPDLTRFRGRGGKIVMYYGWADPALNALMGVEYYEQVLSRMGASTAGFFRLFMVPGMFHCAGGVGCGTFDALTTLIEWVEKGAAPSRIAASALRDGKVVRTRPLCPYPEVARYSGQGSAEEAANFNCVKP